jgi:hypothetical protein
MSSTEELAIRHNASKLRWTLVDFDSLEGMVKVLEFGAIKYSVDNWKKGLPVKSIIDSLLRHTVSYLNGEDIDPESQLPHVDHIMCNAMFLSYMYKNRPDMDNRKH